MVIDGEDKWNACMLSLERCNAEKPCPLHAALSASRNDIFWNLNNKTIKEAISSLHSGDAFLPL